MEAPPGGETIVNDDHGDDEEEEAEEEEGEEEDSDEGSGQCRQQKSGRAQWGHEKEQVEITFVEGDVFREFLAKGK
jgi:hypothetical protein